MATDTRTDGPTTTALYEIVDGNDDHVALVSDKQLAYDLAAQTWCGVVRRRQVDDDYARRLLATLKGER